MNDLIGRTIARRYRIETFLGKGGMAEVYKIWDQKRSVYLAMKILHADLAEDKVFLRRFRREAQTLAKLQHPNIVRFYGLEQDGDLVYILMDYVEGTTLRKEIFQSKGSFSNEKVMEIMRPVCAALNYAHKSGFVHCDVKPANIMIHKNGSIYVSDFGIARMTEASTVTMVGAGTPAYMAPEQARGENPTAQTDIYSLGVVLFEMLTGGERPFTGENAKTTGSTSEKLRWEQMRLAPPLPSKFNSSITSNIDEIVTKCLDKSPTTRYPNTLDLLNTLTRSMPQMFQPNPVAQVGTRQPIEKDEKNIKTPPDQQVVNSKERGATTRDHNLIDKTRNRNQILKGIAAFITTIGLVLFSFITVSKTRLPVSPPSDNEVSLVVIPTNTNRPTPTPIKPTPTHKPTTTPLPSFVVRPFIDKTDTDSECVWCRVEDLQWPKEPGHYYWNVDFPVNTPAFLEMGWCALDQLTLDKNWQLMEYELIIDGYKIDLSQLDLISTEETDWYCYGYQGILEEWSKGTHTQIWVYHIDKSFFDGWDVYKMGDYIFEFVVTVR